MWYKCLPYVTNNVLNNKPLMKVLIWLRSVMLIKRNPDSLGSTAITMESDTLQLFTYTLWTIMGVPYVSLASYYILFRYFPWKQITWNFLSQFQLFKGLIHMTIVSPAYLALNVLFLLDSSSYWLFNTDPEYTRDTTYLRI